MSWINDYQINLIYKKTPRYCSHVMLQSSVTKSVYIRPSRVIRVLTVHQLMRLFYHPHYKHTLYMPHIINVT
jgi:hypothetical protein